MCLFESRRYCCYEAYVASHSCTFCSVLSKAQNYQGHENTECEHNTEKAAMKRFHTGETLIFSSTARKDCKQSPDYNRSRHENNL